MGYLLDQMEKIALAETQGNNSSNAERLVNGVAGTLAVGTAGGLTSMLPSQLETLRHNAMEPMRAARLGLTHTRGSEARRFLAQEKSLLRNAHKALRAGDEAKATKIVKQMQSPTHRAWRGFKSMHLPGKFKLLAPVLGAAAGTVGLGTAGIYGIDRAFNG